jgi:hypothetical protein
VPCLDIKELETSHRQLGDLVASVIPSRLLDGTACLLDGVVVQLSKDIEAGGCLVVIEGFCRSLAKHEDALEHGDSRLTDCCLGWWFILAVIFVIVAVQRQQAIIIRRVGLFVGGSATFTPGTVLGFLHFNVTTRSELVHKVLLAASSHREVRSRSCNSQLLN